MGGVRNADFGELAGDEVLPTSQHRASPFDPIARFDRHIRSRGVTINLDCAALSSSCRREWNHVASRLHASVLVGICRARCADANRRALNSGEVR
jgi:hypothetical protein